MKDQRGIFRSLAWLSAELIVVLFLFGISLLGFVLLTHQVFHLENTRFDTRIFEEIRPHITEANTRIATVVTFLADRAFLLPANLLLIGILLFRRKSARHPLNVVVVSLGGLIISQSLKLYFSRIRPTDPVHEAAHGFSYPSGHSLSAMTFYGLLIYLVWTNVQNNAVRWALVIGLSLLILAIGGTRVYLRVHFASDVLAGFALGFIWLTLSLWILKKMFS